MRTLAVLGEHLDAPWELDDAAVLFHLREEAVGGREERVDNGRRRGPLAAAGEVEGKQKEGDRAETGGGGRDQAVEIVGRNGGGDARRESGGIWQRGDVQELRRNAAVLERIPAPGIR